METRPASQLPWPAMALGITVILLAILTVQALVSEPPQEKRNLNVTHPIGPVDELFPVRWEGELPDGDYQFRVVIKEDRVQGKILVESELLPADTREWTPPADTSRRTWGRIVTKLFAVREDGSTEENNRVIRAPDIVAWER